jgi:hypothetical protein
VAYWRASNRRGRGLAPRVRPLVSGLALVAIATLVLLHVAVLWDRVVHGRLTDPEIGLRWLGAVVLTAGLLVLRRLGIPLLWGRRALVFWLLVLLLHAGATAPDNPALHADSVRLLFVMPASVASVGTILVLLVAQVVRRSPGRPGGARPRAFVDRGPAPRGGALLPLPARAPPF